MITITCISEESGRMVEGMVNDELKKKAGSGCKDRLMSCVVESHLLLVNVILFVW